jgi:hypothetical protein
MPRYTITNFSRGEFSPVLYGRVDIPQYSAGAKEITNFIIQRYGGVAFRPGFRFVGEVDDPAETYRYLPFVFSIDQAYVMVLGDYRLRLLASGGYVAEDDLAIVSITYGATTIIQVPFHDMVVGDRIYIDGTNVPALNGRFAEVLSVPDASHLEIDLNTSDLGCFGTFTTSTGITRTGAPTPPPAPDPPPAVPPPDPDPPTTTSPNYGSGGDTGTGIYGRTRYGTTTDIS